MDDSKPWYGFTAKVTGHGAGMYLRIPELTKESSGICDGDLLELKIRDMKGEETTVGRKVQVSSGQAKVYLPKPVKKELGLGHRDVVDVFFTKD